MDAQHAWWPPPSAVALVLANLVPLGGVLYFDWAVFPLLLLFWLENLVIGGYTLARMLIAQGGADVDLPIQRLAGNLFLCAFFTIHFGAFCAGHGFFLTTMFGEREAVAGADFNLFNPMALLIFAARVVMQHGLWWALLALIASHGISYYFNYLRPRRYEDAVAGDLMAQPYKRIFVLHVVIILGGFAAIASHAQLPALVLLLVLKTGVDLYAHLREHRAADGVEN